MPFAFCEKCGRTWVVSCASQGGMSEGECGSCDAIMSWRQDYCNALRMSGQHHIDSGERQMKIPSRRSTATTVIINSQ